MTSTGLSNGNFCIIPAIDLINGCVVRLRQGDYDHQTRYDDTPLTWAKRFEAAGFSRLHIIDLDGAKSGNTDNKNAITTIRSQTTLAIQIGGGLRTPDSIRLYDDCGVTYFILGSLLIQDYTTALTLINQYPHRIIAGLDHRDNYLQSSGWTAPSTLSLDAMLAQLHNQPLNSLIITDIKTDGMLQGPNITHIRACLAQTKHPILVSGGIRNQADIDACHQIGSAGCIIGRSILSGQLSIQSPELL